MQLISVPEHPIQAIHLSLNAFKSVTGAINHSE